MPEVGERGKSANMLTLNTLTLYTMSKDQNTQNETVETVETVANELTVEEQKAQRVLRAKLPALDARHFNFEKRTGNVFTGTLVKVLNEDGVQVIENGAPKEKLTRKVVIIEDEETGELLPEFEDIAADLQAKRAAAYVLGADTLKGKLEAKVLELEKQLEATKDEIDSMGITLAASCEIVMSVELPEPAARVNVTAKLTAATDKIAKMKAMLIAAGLSEEEVNEQLNG